MFLSVWNKNWNLKVQQSCINFDWDFDRKKFSQNPKTKALSHKTVKLSGSIDYYQIVDGVKEEDAEGQEDQRGQRAFVDAALRCRRHRRFGRVVHVRLIESSDESGDLIQIRVVH